MTPKLSSFEQRELCSEWADAQAGRSHSLTQGQFVCSALQRVIMINRLYIFQWDFVSDSTARNTVTELMFLKETLYTQTRNM